jgi:hypothetical protein
MITKTQEPDGRWRYVCDVCMRVRIEKYPNLRNPCTCNGIKRKKLKEPSLLQKGENFIKAAVKHVTTGAREATDEQVLERFNICQECPLYNAKRVGEGTCTHPSCGCSLKTVGLTGKNKLRWAEQICPIGKWLPV